MELPFRIATGVVAALLAFGGAGARADITVVSWGGTYTESQQKAYGVAWEERTGSKIHWVNYNGGLGEIRAQVAAGKVTWDIVVKITAICKIVRFGRKLNSRTRSAGQFRK